MPGGREETVKDSEILQIFLEEEDPVLFTGEVSDVLGFSNQGTLSRLHDLADRGLLGSKKRGRSIVWWLTDDGRDFLSDAGS